MIPFRSLLVLLLLAARLAAAGPVDAGAGLGYLRVTDLAAQLPDVATALAAGHPLVLDLRYAATEHIVTDDVYRTLARHTGTEPLFILVSPATAPLVADALAATPAKCVTLGVRESVPTPQVMVDQTAAADREAYLALTPEHPLAALVSGKVVKDRYDEAALVNDFRNGSADSGQPDDVAKEKPAATEAKAAPVPTDRVLQRALHLYQALQATQPRR